MSDKHFAVFPRAVAAMATAAALLIASNSIAKDAVRVTTAPAQPLTRQNVLSLTGSVTSLQQAHISARTDGLVAEILADTGDEVTQGQALLRLDANLAELDRDRARAARNEALAARDEAQRLWQEARRLRENNHVSENEVKSRRAALTLAEASAAAAQASLASSVEVLDRHTLPAPFTGVVSARLAEIGEWVNRGDPVFEVVSLDQLRVDVRVPQERFADINLATPVSVCSDVITHPCTDGEIAARVPVGDPNSRTFLIRVAVPGKDGSLLPGTSAEVRLVIDQQHATDYLVPRQSVLQHPDGSRSVFVVADGRAQRRLIEVSEETADGLVVGKGLSADDRIVVRGAELLTEGDAVTVNPSQEG